ncbi:type II toxin-antitoxin system Phd/YefM family antitoxin [Flexivirga oryzae]|uniref:Antitoxin n=1 Tax=Flexivirga oryzae TaxID=1794944 RepID=A0A839N1G8_9MICO|nr:type II toxin-antitoxin system Phd/YefM family antitoxin [Flexivirga oryzae]MBB2891600.1 prevent-host-death family protein [Flexivirga oryzae]
MRTVTATEASRSFAAILDEAERGHSVVVTRGGRRIATIGPADASNGADFLALLDGNATDEGFAADVTAAREAAVLEGPVWPAD